MMYLLYARTGHEFEAEADLHERGIDAWCGRVIEFKRVGKSRKPQPIEKPALPNYIFAELSPREFYTAQGVKWLASTFVSLSRADVEAVVRYRAEVRRAYEEADRARRANEVPLSEFKPGETLELVGGPLAEKMGTFRRVVERSHDLHPHVELEVDGLRVQADPLDVRRA